MPTSDERRLKLIKGLSAGGVSRTGRTVTRRTVARRPASASDPLEEMLRRLDQEPTGDGGRLKAADPADGADPTADADPADHAAATDGADAVDDGEPTGGREPVDDVAPVDGAEEPRADAVGRRRRLRPHRPAPATVLLAVALCLALVGAGIGGYRWYQDRALEQARQHALAAAKQTTVNFVSISASSVDQDLGRIVAGSTGEFREQFTRGQDQVRAAVVENKVESQGSVLRAGLLSGDRNSATALVAVDATVRNTHAPQGRDSHYRIQVDLTRDRDSGDWLVSRLQFVG